MYSRLGMSLGDMAKLGPLASNDSSPTINRQTNKARVGQVVIPYTKGIEESIKQICGKYGIQVHFKGTSYQCHHLDCDE